MRVVKVEVPTGRGQYRVHKPWFRPQVCILQLEWHVKGEYEDGPQFELVEWRDARPEDITNFVRTP